MITVTFPAIGLPFNLGFVFLPGLGGWFSFLRAGLADGLAGFLVFVL
jgi:hypothetical protein